MDIKVFFPDPIPFCKKNLGVYSRQLWHSGRGMNINHVT